MLNLTGKFTGVCDGEYGIQTDVIELKREGNKILGVSKSDKGEVFPMKVITQLEDLIIMGYSSINGDGVCVFTNITETSAEGIYMIRDFESVGQSCSYYKIEKEI